MTTTTVQRSASRTAVVLVLVVALLGVNAPRAQAFAVVPGLTSAVGTSAGIGVALPVAGIIGGALVIGWAATGEWPWQWLDGEPTSPPTGWTATVVNEGGPQSGKNIHYQSHNFDDPATRLEVLAWRGYINAPSRAACDYGPPGNTGNRLWSNWYGPNSSLSENPISIRCPVMNGSLALWRINAGSCSGCAPVVLDVGYTDPGNPGPDTRQVTVTNTWTCTNGTDPALVFSESNVGTVEAPPSMPASSCPAGTRLDTITGTRSIPGEDDEQIIAWSSDAPNAGTGIGLDDPANDMAHCWDPGLGQPYGCRLQLQKLIDSTAGLWADCTTLGTQCAGWLEHPNRDDIYRCEATSPTGLVAPKVVPLEDCKVFGPTFNPDSWGDVETEPKPQEQDPDEEPKPVPITPVWPDADPETPGDQPYPDDGTDPQMDPEPEIDPETGLPKPQPGVNPQNPDLDPSPGATPGLDDGCVPRWWEVLTPWGATKAVACALQWAFVPSPATMTRLQQIPDTATTKAPFGWFSPMLGALDGFDGASSQCWVIDVTMPAGWLGASAPEDERTVHILDSCSNEPLVQAIHNLRPLLTVLAYSSLIMPILWWAWRTYAPASTSSA